MISSSSRAIYQALSNRLKLLTNLNDQLNSSIPDIDEEINELDAQEAYEEITNKEISEEKVVRIKSKINEEIEILTKCVTLAKKTSFGR